MSQPFLLGVNYWPIRKAMYWWERFDAAEVRDEFSMIKDIGLSHVRFFLLWESFQPKPTEISKSALKNLGIVCDTAADLGLLLEPTFFTGHMSGPNWAPDWLVSNEPRDPGDRRALVTTTRSTASPNRIYNTYTEPFVIEAEKLHLRTIVGAFKDHPSIWAWSLGNEPDLFCRPPTAADGKKWIADMTATIKAIDAKHPVLIGLHTDSLFRDNGLRVNDVAATTDLSVMHGYSIYSPLARQPLDPDWVPFTCALTAALANRPVLYEEFGLATREHDAPSGYEQIRLPLGHEFTQWFSSDQDGAEYYDGVLNRLHRVGAIGAFTWCFGDYTRDLWDCPPCDHVRHERFFGLFRADHKLKSLGQVVSKFAKSNPTVQSPERQVKLDISPDEYYRDPMKHLPGLYERFGAL
jgi:endo-1,4-beta-mannosidase